MNIHNIMILIIMCFTFSYYAEAGLVCPLTFATWLATFTPVMILAAVAIITMYQLIWYRQR